MSILHNKLFRDNLIRWFFLYIGVISVFTSVVTYSKYITSLEPASEEARTAKFDIKITNDKICSTLSNMCNLATYKPYDEIEYYFTVDTTDMEVLADLALKISVDPEFRIVSFTYVDTTEFTVSMPSYGTVPDSLINQTLPDQFKLTYINNSEDSTKNNTITLVGETGAYKSKIQTYKIRLKFMKDSYDSSYSSTHEYSKIVKVGYAANQKI